MKYRAVEDARRLAEARLPGLNEAVKKAKNRGVGMEILIYHTRQTGDVIIGAHCAKLVRKKYPDATITFVTGPHLVDLISPCDWIDLVVPEPEFNDKDLMTYKELHTATLMSKWCDMRNEYTFNKLREDWKPDLAFRPTWSPLPRGLAYEPPYMFRCYAARCGLTSKESNDTAYRIPVSNEERAAGVAEWEQTVLGGERIALHMDSLPSEFESLVESHGVKIIDTSGERSLRQNLALFAAADLVITRYGGVAVMSASVGTPTLTIPKPEPTMWASPVYSHPNEGHVILLPRPRCKEYEGTSFHRLQPCQPVYGTFTKETCPLGRTKMITDEKDGFHCWRDVDVKQVQDHLNRQVDQAWLDESENTLGKWVKENPW